MNDGGECLIGNSSFTHAQVFSVVPDLESWPQADAKSYDKLCFTINFRIACCK